MSRVIQAAGWVSKYELWVVLAASPFLLFPVGGLPFLSLFVIGLVWLSRRISSGRFGYLTNLDILIVLLIFSLLVGYGVSIKTDLSWTRMWNYLLGVFVFYAVVNTYKPSIHWQFSVIIVALLTVGVVLYSVVGTDWSAVRIFEIPGLYERFPSLLRNIPGSGVPRGSDLMSPRTIGLTLGLLLPFLTTYLLFYSIGKLKLVLAITVLLGGIALLMTQTLEALCGLCAGLIFIAIWRNRKTAYLLLALLFSGIGLLLVLGAQEFFVYLLSADNPVGIAVVLRLDMWSRAAAMIRDMPFTGIGLNIFPTIQSNFYPGFIIGPEPHAHNLYIQTALDQGLPGLGAMIFLFLAWVIGINKNYRSTSTTGQRILYVALMSAIISFLVQGLMDSMTLGAKTAPILWAFFGMGVIPDVANRADKHITPTRTIPWLRVIGPFALMVAILGGIFFNDPAAIQRNFGSLLAQQALFDANAEAGISVDKAQLAREKLTQAIVKNPDSSHLFQMVSRLDSWMGNDDTAISYLAKSVDLDLRDPFFEYFPPGFLLQRIQGSTLTSNNNSDLLNIYTNWLIRFPKRSEGYLLCSILTAQNQHNSPAAVNYLNRGLENSAEPKGILLYYLETLKKNRAE